VSVASYMPPWRVILKKSRSYSVWVVYVDWLRWVVQLRRGQCSVSVQDRRATWFLIPLGGRGGHGGPPLQL